MTQNKVVIKRIVSPDCKVIAEAKSVVSKSTAGATQISQTVAVNISSNHSSSSYTKSSSSSSSTSSCFSRS